MASAVTGAMVEARSTVVAVARSMMKWCVVRRELLLLQEEVDRVHLELDDSLEETMGFMWVVRSKLRWVNSKGQKNCLYKSTFFK